MYSIKLIGFFVQKINTFNVSSKYDDDEEDRGDEHGLEYAGIERVHLRVRPNVQEHVQTMFGGMYGGGESA